MPAPGRRAAAFIGVAALVGALATVVGLQAGSARADQTIASDGPLTRIAITSDLNCAVNHVGDSAGEWYGDTACGTLVAVGGLLFGPADIPAGEGATTAPGYTPYTPVSQTQTGAGTSSSPYQITTTVALIPRPTPAPSTSSSGSSSETTEPSGPTSTVTTEPDGPSTTVTTEPDGPSTTVTTEPDGPSTTVTTEPDGPSTSDTTEPTGDPSSSDTTEPTGDPSSSDTTDSDAPSDNTSSLATDERNLDAAAFRPLSEESSSSFSSSSSSSSSSSANSSSSSSSSSASGSSSGATGSSTSAVPTAIANLTEIDTYVVGDENYKTSVTLTNATDATLNAIVYRAGDCFLQDSDDGLGEVQNGNSPVCKADPTPSNDDGASDAASSENVASSSGVGPAEGFARVVAAAATTSGASESTGSSTSSESAGPTPPQRIEGMYPLTPGSSFLEDNYDTVWRAVGAKTDLPNTCQCDSRIDNGIALSWPVSPGAHASSTISALTVFSPLGSSPLTFTKTASEPTATPGATDGYTVTISNPGSTPTTLTSVTDTLPDGFSYVPGTSTTAFGEPSVVGQQVTWHPDNVVVPPADATAGTVQLHFDVTVSSNPGTYLNSVTGTATAGEQSVTIIPAERVAPIEVTGTTPTDTPTTEPPTTEPPTTEPPTTSEPPPTSQPPTTQPPTTEPPTTEPPTTEPPTTSQPPTTQPPTSSQPPTSQPPTTKPPVSTTPTSAPPVTQPPVTQTPVTTQPAVTNPPAVVTPVPPAVTEPPRTQPTPPSQTPPSQTPSTPATSPPSNSGVDSLTLTARSVIPGGALRAAGTGCSPNSNVQLTIAGRPVGSGTADAGGRFTVPVSTTGLDVGTYNVNAVCGDRHLIAQVALVYVTANSNAPTAQALVVAAALAFFLLLLGLIARRPT